MSRVVIHWNGWGPEFELITDDPTLDVLSLSDVTTNDRLYRLKKNGGVLRIVTPAEMDKLIGDGKIGQLGDRPIVEQAVRAKLALAPNQKPALSIVQPDPPEARKE